MNTSGNTISSRQAIINGLAVAGFIALMVAGMWLAVYSTRFVPEVAGRIGSAAVYLSSVFTPEPSLSVVPQATTTPSTSATSTATTTKPLEIITIPSSNPVKPVAGNKIDGVQQIGTTTPGTPYGYPDLTVKIVATGYLATTSASSFIASSTVPAGARPAVNFIIKNSGTNITGPWSFSASIPTQSSYIFQSQPQQTLAPGDSIEYTLGFDQATTGTNKAISITANPGNTLTESDTANNTASTSITILGN